MLIKFSLTNKKVGFLVRKINYWESFIKYVICPEVKFPMKNIDIFQKKKEQNEKV